MVLDKQAVVMAPMQSAFDVTADVDQPAEPEAAVATR